MSDRIAWGAKVSDTFLERVGWIVTQLDIGQNVPDGMTKLMSCIAWESGRTFKANTRNMAGSGATGLIQFMPSTARQLGTTTKHLASLTAEDQLNYVYKYFEPYKGKLKTLSDLYMAILWPKGVGEPETYTLWDRDSMPTTYRQNSGLDTNKDAYITKAEAAGKVTATMIEGLKEGNMRIFGIKIGGFKLGHTLSDVIDVAAVILPPVGAARDVVDNIEDRHKITVSDVVDTVQVARDVIEATKPEPGIVAKPTVTTTVAKAASGWQGNLAGVVTILAVLMTNTSFTTALADFTVRLSKGGGGMGALIALLGAALVAYKHQPPAT